MEAVIFVGIQGSGKSTFFRQRFFDTHIRLSLDTLKTRYRENLLVDACIASKQKFVIDNTNLTRTDREKFIVKAKAAKFKVVGYCFRAELEAAIARNDLRTGKAKIPKLGILGAYKRLQIPTMDEGFDELFYVQIGETKTFMVEQWINEV